MLMLFQKEKINVLHLTVSKVAMLVYLIDNYELVLFQ